MNRYRLDPYTRSPYVGTVYGHNVSQMVGAVAPLELVVPQYTEDGLIETDKSLGQAKDQMLQSAVDAGFLFGMKVGALQGDELRLRERILTLRGDIVTLKKAHVAEWDSIAQNFEVKWIAIMEKIELLTDRFQFVIEEPKLSSIEEEFQPQLQGARFASKSYQGIFDSEMHDSGHFRGVIASIKGDIKRVFERNNRNERNNRDVLKVDVVEPALIPVQNEALTFEPLQKYAGQYQSLEREVRKLQIEAEKLSQSEETLIEEHRKNITHQKNCVMVTMYNEVFNIFFRLNLLLKEDLERAGKVNKDLCLGRFYFIGQDMGFKWFHLDWLSRPVTMSENQLYGFIKELKVIQGLVQPIMAFITKCKEGK